MSTQKGSLLPGMILGFLLGVAVSLGVGLYVTKAPIPFINKVPQRSSQSDATEAERNRSWNPNAPLQGSTAARPVPPAPAPAPAPTAPAETLSQPASPYFPETAAPTAARVPAEPASPGAAPGAATARPAERAAAGSTRDPAAILSGGAVPGAPAEAPAGGAYYVQTGAFAKMQDAERQQAALVMQGLSARIVPHDQSGRLVYRVRIGPLDSREDADLASARARASGAVEETRLLSAQR